MESRDVALRGSDAIVSNVNGSQPSNGCAQVLNAYGMGAADMIRRTVR